MSKRSEDAVSRRYHSSRCDLVVPLGFVGLERRQRIAIQVSSVASRRHHPRKNCPACTNLRLDYSACSERLGNFRRAGQLLKAGHISNQQGRTMKLCHVLLTKVGRVRVTVSLTWR